MKQSPGRSIPLFLFTLFVALTLNTATPVFGLIDLEWRVGCQRAMPGQTVEIGLYAVSSNATDQSISAMEVILSWDPLYLQLTGVVSNGPYQWLFSGFSNDSGLDGLNDSWLDGDALYSAYAQLGQAAYATPAGLLIATLQFDALAEVPLTVLSIPDELGQYSHTRVYDGEEPGLDVLRTTGYAGVSLDWPGFIHSWLTCLPDSGTVPFETRIQYGLGSSHTDQHRTVAARIDLALASGEYFSSFRNGYSNLFPGEFFVASWQQTVPELASVLGINQLTLYMEDVTPSPYNQPPYAPAGETSSQSCTIEGIAP